MFHDNYIQNIKIPTVIKYEAFIKFDVGKSGYPVYMGNDMVFSVIQCFVIFFVDTFSCLTK